MPATRVKPIPTKHIFANHSRICTSVFVVVFVAVVIGETLAFILEMHMPWWIALSVSLGWTTFSVVVDRQPCGCRDDERASNPYSIFL